MPGQAHYPAQGCIVEFFDASSTQIGVVIEESGGKLRLLLPNRREMKLPATRALPWLGPMVAGFSSQTTDALVKILAACREKRDALAKSIPVQELWEMAQGEVSLAPATWFAELMESDPDEDTVAAYAHALLQTKTRFRFMPPNFEVYTEEMAARREAEQARQRERERLLSEGGPFFHTLWNVVLKRCALPEPGTSGYPCPETADKLSSLLFARMSDPETQDEDALWKLLIKGLPEVPHLPVQLLEAWGKIPEHYNFWFDRAGYDPGDAWWQPFKNELDAYLAAQDAEELPECNLPFISIDGESTLDVDDAFHLVSRPDGSMTLTLALACPALDWPWGSALDKAVLHRGTSVYLPEGDCHMLPAYLGTDGLSLLEGQPRPALVLAQDVAATGERIGECRMSVGRVRLAANLRYHACQDVLDGKAGEDNPALAYRDMLELGKAFSEARLATRIAGGAAVLERKEPKIVLHDEGQKTTVELVPETPAKDAQNMVAEMMILASAAAADWAYARGIPMAYRTQDVALPREYAGVWSEPQDITRIMHAMIPSVLDTQPRPHAALGLARYAPMTSPLRRYADLLNEAQLISFVREGTALFDEQALSQLLLSLSVDLEGASHIQRYRPRYWKLLYFRQQGDRVWWNGIITEENDAFVNVSLPEQDIFIRGRRRLFDERASAGMPVAIRIGKVNPLYNEMQIVEALPEDSLPEGEI